MKLLLLGYSSIARRRVLPALAALHVEGVDVATRSAADRVTLPGGLRGKVFSDYSHALSDSNAGIVYISTVNSNHAELAVAAIASGRHVVVDKPATTSFADTQHLISLAEKRGVLLAEATVYGYHPQITAAQRVFADAGSRPTRILAAFSFPGLPPDNFRHRPELGGGVLLDLGPYAVSPGRIFFGDTPSLIQGSSNESDAAFAILAAYGDGRTVVGQYGTGTVYANHLQLLGPGVGVIFDRVFTTDADKPTLLRVTQGNETRTITIEPADSFAIFLQTVFDAIRSGNHAQFASTMFADAEALERLRVACHAVPVSRL